MLLTLALIILISSVLVLFSQEFAEMIKKIFRIPGMTLGLPLLLATWLIVRYEAFIVWTLMGYRIFLNRIIEKLSSLLLMLPYREYWVTIVVLMLTSIVPVLGISIWVKYKTHKPYPYVYLVGGGLWVLSAILLILP